MAHLPPIAALRALATAARHLSFTKAAAELNVTQSAVSHQIRHIEELWDIQLFERRPRQLLLTPAGEQLAGIVNHFIDELGAALEDLKAEEGHTALRVEMLPSLAVKWLVPRLQGFRAEHPEVDVWLSTRQDIRPAMSSNLDAVITLGDGQYPGFSAWELMRDYVIPVARPRLLEEYGMPETPAELCRLPLLLRHSGVLSPGWEYWFDYAGVAPDVYQSALREGTRFPDTNMAIQAAFEGQGVVLARSAHVWEDLETGRLVRLFDIHCPSDVSVYFVCRNDQAERPALIAFRDWLLKEANESQAAFDAAETDHPKKAARGS
jgi:LysR family glycine cleavage system transcriptional activator